MKLNEPYDYRGRAAYCSQQSELAKDDIFKKYWDDLANDWLALEKAIMEKDKDGKPIRSR
jgi:lipoprotein NlpI